MEFKPCQLADARILFTQNNLHFMRFAIGLRREEVAGKRNTVAMLALAYKRAVRLKTILFAHSPSPFVAKLDGIIHL